MSLFQAQLSQSAIDAARCAVYKNIVLEEKMEPCDLEAVMRDFGLSSSDCAQLLGVSARAVNSWLSGSREIPGPVGAYFNLFREAGALVRDRQIMRARGGGAKFGEGIYTFEVSGSHGAVKGVALLQNGRICGTDGFCDIDGSYRVHMSGQKPDWDRIDVDIKVTVPTDISTIQGMPAQRMPYSYAAAFTFEYKKRQFIPVKAAFGDLNFMLEFRRPLPD